MIMDCVCIVIWLAIGVLVMSSKKVTKLDYVLCWCCLMANLITRIMTKWN